MILEFIKKWWKFILVGFSIAGAFVTGILLKKKPVIIQGDDPAKKAAENTATKETTIADLKRKEEITAAVQEHNDELKAVVAKEEKVTKDIVDDPKEVNEYLQDVGKSMRGP